VIRHLPDVGEATTSPIVLRTFRYPKDFDENSQRPELIALRTFFVAHPSKFSALREDHQSHGASGELLAGSGSSQARKRQPASLLERRYGAAFSFLCRKALLTQYDRTGPRWRSGESVTE